MSPSLPPSARAVYLSPEAGPVFGFLHPAAGDSQRDAAVLLLPPFGWDEVASYRSRRDWALHLAGEGYPTLRLDLPGSGNSSGSARDPERLPTWVAAISSAASWLRATTSCRRVVALGIGLGGFLSCVAVGEGAPIDDLVLWATPSRGRRLVRELRAFASLEGADWRAGSSVAPPPQPAAEAGSSLEGDDLHVAGFVLTPETIAALEGVNLASLPMRRDATRRVLMLERDGAPVDQRLLDHLETTGGSVAVAPGPGFGVMTGDPNQAKPPLEVFERVTAWLGEAAAGGDLERTEIGETPDVPGSAPGAPACDLALEEAGVAIRETPIAIDQSFGKLFGVLTEPAAGEYAPVCVVLLNAASIRHTGPNRMWVEAARRWAARGVATLRLDLQGLGDADGDRGSAALAALHEPRRIAQVRDALDELEARGLGPSFALGGLCSGAYWSFHAALEDERVTAALMLNPMTLFWDPTLERTRELRRIMRDPVLWRRAVRGEVNMARVVRLIRWLPRAPSTVWRRTGARRQARRAGEHPVEHALDRLRDSGKRVLLAFSAMEPLHEELVRDGCLRNLERWPNLVLDSLPGNTHTLRSAAAQHAAHESLDRALIEHIRLRVDVPSRLPARP